MSGLGISWDLAAGVAAFAVVLGLGYGWRWIRRSLRRLVRRTFRTGRQRSYRRQQHSYQPAPRRLQDTSPVVLTRFWVVDGDTVQDNATKTIYRLQNIDCPETDERAKCYRERKQGERAKFEAVRLLKGAKAVIVRPTGKIDPYGRSIAAIDVDGLDFGQLMIDRGFARPWRGVREDWCGPNGGLARMAEACSAKFHCKTCGGRAGIADQQNVVSFPAVYPASVKEQPSETEQAITSPSETSD
jgi:micrococcal nuclease